MQHERTTKGRQLETSIRLFKNPFLENLSHVHPVVPLVMWLPVVVVLLARAWAIHQLAPINLALIACAGVLTWTLTEYCLHRFVFHYPARSDIGRRLVFLFHGVHHDSPQDKTRLVMPPTGALLILAVLWWLFSLAIPRPWLEPFMAAFIAGYLVYDYLHYATHHFAMRHPVLRYIKHHHMLHHFADENSYYGVSSPLWDLVFGTCPASGSGSGSGKRR